MEVVDQTHNMGRYQEHLLLHNVVLASRAGIPMISGAPAEIVTTIIIGIDLLPCMHVRTYKSKCFNQ